MSLAPWIDGAPLVSGRLSGRGEGGEAGRIGATSLLVEGTVEQGVREVGKDKQKADGHSFSLRGVPNTEAGLPHSVTHMVEVCPSNPPGTTLRDASKKMVTPVASD